MIPRRVAAQYLPRCLSTSNTPQRIPWFVSPDDPEYSLDIRRRSQPQSVLQQALQVPPIPEDTPDYLRKLHLELSTSPYLDTSSLVIARPAEPIGGPPLPFLRPKGRRRRRGGTTEGVGIDIAGNGLWNWFVFVQVKEGTEAKGSINRVVKIVRKMLGQLSNSEPAVTLPPKARQSFTDGWAVLDVGNFAVHILSRDARDKWFPAQFSSMTSSI